MEAFDEIREGAETVGREVCGISGYKNKFEGEGFDVGGVDGCEA